MSTPTATTAAAWTESWHRMCAEKGLDPDDAPGGWRYASAVWLLSRHDRLAELAARTGAVTIDQAGEPDLDLDGLAESFAGWPRYSAAWAEYERRTGSAVIEQLSDAEYDAWTAAGPAPRDFGRYLAPMLPMSSTEPRLLRLLAMLGNERVPWSLGDVAGLDGTGQRVLRDWMLAVAAY